MASDRATHATLGNKFAAKLLRRRQIPVTTQVPAAIVLANGHPKPPTQPRTSKARKSRNLPPCSTGRVWRAVEGPHHYSLNLISKFMAKASDRQVRLHRGRPRSSGEAARIEAWADTAGVGGRWLSGGTARSRPRYSLRGGRWLRRGTRTYAKAPRFASVLQVQWSPRCLLVCASWHARSGRDIMDWHGRWRSSSSFS